MITQFYFVLCLFGIAFVAVLALAVLNRLGIFNRRATGVIALLVVAPLMCGIVLLFLLSATQMRAGMPAPAGIWP